MIEERILLVSAYVAITALLLIFCLYSKFSNKLKTVVVVVMASFYVFTWIGYKQVLGWPSTQEIPEEFRLIWVSIDEPDKFNKREGKIYFWIRYMDKAGIPFGKPRAYSLVWNEKNHKIAQSALLKLKDGTQLNGRKTYGVLDADKFDEQANPYEESVSNNNVEGNPSFEFQEVAPPSLPPKTKFEN